jgi:hypothetical protein
MALTEDQLAWLQRNRSISGGAAGNIIPSGQASPIMPSGAAEQGESSEAADAGDETASLPPDDGDAGAPAPLSSDEDADAMAASSEDSGAEMPTESSDDTGFDTSTEPPDDGSADTSVEASDDTGFDPSVEPQNDGGATEADTSSDADASPPVAGVPTGATSGRGIVPVERTFETPSLPFNLKYITGTFGLSIKLKGSLEATGGDKGSSSVDVTPGGYSDGGFIERLGHTWYSSEGVRIFGLNTGASESKIESQAKVKDGLEVSISASLKWANGEELKLKFTVVKIEGDWKVTGGALQGDYVFKAITIPIFSFEGAKFKGTAQAVASVKAQPNYAAIAASLGEAGGTAAAAGRAIAVFITFDGLIALGFVAGGVLTVVGAIKALADAAEIRGLHGVVEQTASALTAGFIAGVKGLPNSAGSIGQPGYDMGVKAFAEARGNVLKKVPDATDEEIHEVVSDLVTGKEGRIHELVKPTAQKAVWKAWASSKTGWMDNAENLKWGWVNIYGRLPSNNDSDYKEYYKC